jgi:CheY-like chemotaxis protein
MAGARRCRIVEDNRVTALTTKAALEAAGHEVVLELDSRRAHEHIEAAKPDGVILDLAMPGVNGSTLISKLRANDALEGLTIIVYQGKAFEFDRQCSLELGCVATTRLRRYDSSASQSTALAPAATHWPSTAVQNP